MRKPANFSTIAGVLVFGSSALAFNFLPVSRAGAADSVFFTISPRTESVIQDSTFEVSIFLDTRGKNINTIHLDIKFSPDKLSVIRPSGGQSFVSIWSEPPVYSNTDGTISFSGGVPNGIVTGNGLITTITFKAKASGDATVRILASSKVLANDGFGSELPFESGRANLSVVPKAPDGIKVFSSTHLFEDKWYNNPNPVISWEKPPGVTDFSYELDNKPSTVPDNAPDATDTIKSYENLGDGVWYFHIKPRENGVWGAATNFAIHIDTAPPADFTPQVELLTGNPKKALVSFFSTDALSGIDHYEIGILNASKPQDSPGFVDAESPQQLSALNPGDLSVIVRAVDRAGNVRDAHAQIYVAPSLAVLARQYIAYVLGFILFFIIFHFLIGHRILRRVRMVFALWQREKLAESGALQKFESDEEEMIQHIPLPVPPKEF